MNTWTVKMCTHKDLCALYGVSYKILVQQLKPFEKEIGEKHGNFYNIVQVLKIIELLGEPPEVDIIYPKGKPSQSKT